MTCIWFKGANIYNKKKMQYSIDRKAQLQLNAWKYEGRRRKKGKEEIHVGGKNLIEYFHSLLFLINERFFILNSSWVTYAEDISKNLRNKTVYFWKNEAKIYQLIWDEGYRARVEIYPRKRVICFVLSCLKFQLLFTSSVNFHSIVMDVDQSKHRFTTFQ